GKMLKYSYSLMNTCWTVSKNSDGWCILAKSIQDLAKIFLQSYEYLLDCKQEQRWMVYFG
ncbi:hypothetical protein D5R40_33730, partial [Okeania hirsuta]